ncbi:MAG TPA: prepilin-type N-terminal cleavage/methylation domain-containing protein [Gemmatimonadaceae bacterium]|nr:prepilin-type N-terminal cleavage/methylation domain-containing protein [Gemmatimonadaceae bacterium]
MLTSRVARARAGLTLAELLIALAVAGIVLALLAAISVREQRAFSDLADRAALAGQLREASAILPVDLRALSPALGDVRDARDTAVEVRATIASGVVCDTAANALILPPPIADSSALYATSIGAVSPGDTAWLLDTGDSASTWRPFAVTLAGATRAGQCAAGGPHLSPTIAAQPRGQLTVSGSIPGGAVGSPLRVTRPMRYSIYRASDRAWYLGARDWNAAAMRFNTIQPVAGPLLSVAAGGVAFGYRDSAGSPLAMPVVNGSSIRMVDIVLRGQTRSARTLSTGPQRDSAHIMIALRNR